MAATLTSSLGYGVPLLGRIPIDPGIGAGGDEGIPLVLSESDGPAASVLQDAGTWIANRGRGLAGRRLALEVA
ncbi:MAG TPA: hypothetical protein VHG10_06490 [Glycomyces sp.]|nr:hypothetical protein [Glycomyces sp.]